MYICGYHKFWSASDMVRANKSCPRLLFFMVKTFGYKAENKHKFIYLSVTSTFIPVLPPRWNLPCHGEGIYPTNKF